MTMQVEVLSGKHDFSAFDCGVPVLNMWPRTTARQHPKKGTSSTFVLFDDAEPTIIFGYYALAIRGLVLSGDLSPAIAKRLPTSVPALTLARLAVDNRAQKPGHGEYLLVDAMRRAKQAATQVGGTLLFVDAKDGDGAVFYKKYGFVALHSAPLTLCIAIATIPE